MSESLAVRRAETSAAITRVREILDSLASRDHSGEILTAIRHFPPREAQWGDFPAWVHPDLAASYTAKNIRRLYTHQAAAAESVHAGKNVVIVTPTDARKAIREKSHVVLTNPDMLHTGILPHHTRWTRLFENLRYIVIDELHTYRGVFGSHLCNVLRRLRRIARFYGCDPQFICCSATIANPGDLATRLLETDVEVLNANGAPAAEKTFVFYNPPVVNRALGIRRSYINESSRVAQEFLNHDLQTMVFANSRLHTEILLTYLQQANPQLPGKPETIRGYRGGYLPNERREIERGLREARIRGVV